MQGRLTLLFGAALFVAACGSDTETPPTTPTPGARLAIAPRPDFLTVGSSVLLEARLSEGGTTGRTTVVAADWSSTDGRVVAVDRAGRISALAPGSTTIRATFGADTASLAMRAVPDFAGTWTGTRRVSACLHPRPDVCATSYPTNRVASTTLVLTQARDRVTGTLSLSPPLASPSAAASGTITELGRLTLDGTIISTPSTGASTTLGTLADFRVEIEPGTGIMRGSFAEARTDADGTAWRVTWEIQGLSRTR
ncbi:MAG: Ig-like domain-containing protein [Vicinamibacteraceae bacterium]